MKYLKLFENYMVDEDEYPEDGHVLSPREEQILEDLVGDYYLRFLIKKEDGYYYTNNINSYYNRFDTFNDLKDYIQFKYFLLNNYPNKLLELVKTTNLDMSFDNNYAIRFASYYGQKEVVKLLLQDPRVDPSAEDNWAIQTASRYGHKEVVKLLLEDPRVRQKLSPEEINKYTNEIS